MLHEDSLLYILQFNGFTQDYSSLFKSHIYKSQCVKQYRHHLARLTTNFIEEHFSRLFYLHYLSGPPTRNEIDSIFIATDDLFLFQSPCYYDISVYMQLFKEFNLHVLDCYLQNRSYTVCGVNREKIFTRRRVSTVEALTLC